MVNFSTLFVSLLALGATAVSAAVHETIQPPSINPRSENLSSRDHINVERMTNAQRLARGEPPLPPRRRNHAELAARSKPSASPTPGRTLTGNIQVTDSKTGEFIGYISKNYQLFGEYGLVKKRKDAVKVKLPGVTNGKSGPLQMIAKNGDQSYPNIGAVVGYWNTNASLSPNSKHYVYIGGVAQTAPGAPPQNGGSAFSTATGATEQIESAIWHFNTKDRRITMAWVNPDGSVASNAKLAYYPADKVIFGVANLPAFKKEYGDAKLITMTLVDE